tara:strand:- start:1491 stop:1814 length:324 start_codon:yes stop_codon:yes gene_type:complete
MVPVYSYRVVTSQGIGESFEVEQTIDSPPLEKHPLTGEKVERLYENPPNLLSKHSENSEKKALSPENLRKNGFSRYERDSGSGSYIKTAGREGPNEIPPNPVTESLG